MVVEFIKDTPYTKREGSKKKFIAGRQYTLTNDYANELITAGVCREVKDFDMNDIFKTKKNKK